VVVCRSADPSSASQGQPPTTPAKPCLKTDTLLLWQPLRMGFVRTPRMLTRWCSTELVTVRLGNLFMQREFRSLRGCDVLPSSHLGVYVSAPSSFELQVFFFFLRRSQPSQTEK
jgi:hypothetical protein